VDGVYPTNHAEHETVEITHGFNELVRVRLLHLHFHNEGQSWQWWVITFGRALLSLRNGTGLWV